MPTERLQRPRSSPEELPEPMAWIIWERPGDHLSDCSASRSSRSSNPSSWPARGVSDPAPLPPPNVAAGRCNERPGEAPRAEPLSSSIWGSAIECESLKRRRGLVFLLVHVADRDGIGGRRSSQSIVALFRQQIGRGSGAAETRACAARPAALRPSRQHRRAVSRRDPHSRSIAPRYRLADGLAALVRQRCSRSPGWPRAYAARFLRLARSPLPGRR